MVIFTKIIISMMKTFTLLRQRIFIFIFISCISVPLLSQEVVVRSFEELPNDLTARTQEKMDVNGNACAVVKVDIPLEDVLFKGWVVETVSTPGEYLVYMPSGSTKLTLQHKSLTPFVYEFEKPLESKYTYRLILEIKKGSVI